MSWVPWRGRPVPVELTSDPRIIGRVRRLAAVSSVALGVVWWLGTFTLALPPAVAVALAAGWLAMPLVLVASLARPMLRYALVVPSTLVTLGLVAIVIGWLPDPALAATGWLLVTVGVLLGGTLGLWLWYRLAPVPRVLDDPVSPGRWALIAVHLGLIVLGLVLIVSGAR